MAVHRTKEQKKRAALRREEAPESVSFSYSGKSVVATTKKSPKTDQLHTAQEAFLKKDLLHSAAVSAIMMLCFVGIYSYLRYNDMTLVSLLF